MATTAPAAASPASSAAAQGSTQFETPRLIDRATFSADYLAPGPQSGRAANPANGRTGPSAGQVIPGFSAAVSTPDGTLWAMPDIGFGTKANSADFRLRPYLVKPRWEKASGGPGTIAVLRNFNLSDPDLKISFPTSTPTHGAAYSPARTSMSSRCSACATARSGSEINSARYLLHVSRTGRVLSAHIPYLLRKSPQSSDLGGERPKARQSGGFEAMAKSRNGRYLYPILEKSLVSDRDPRRRVITEFDTRTRRYTGPRWNYRVDTDANLVADAQMIGGGRLLILERDDYESAGAAC